MAFKLALLLLFVNKLTPGTGNKRKRNSAKMYEKRKNKTKWVLYWLFCTEDPLEQYELVQHVTMIHKSLSPPLYFPLQL